MSMRTGNRSRTTSAKLVILSSPSGLTSQDRTRGQVRAGSTARVSETGGVLAQSRWTRSTNELKRSSTGGARLVDSSARFPRQSQRPLHPQPIRLACPRSVPCFLGSSAGSSRSTSSQSSSRRSDLVALVDIEQWRAERGFSGPGATPSPSEALPAPSNYPPPPQVEAMAEEIARQADLIRALQGALREYVDREERARLVAMNAARRSPPALGGRRGGRREEEKKDTPRSAPPTTAHLRRCPRRAREGPRRWWTWSGSRSRGPYRQGHPSPPSILLLGQEGELGGGGRARLVPERTRPPRSSPPRRASSAKTSARG